MKRTMKPLMWFPLLHGITWVYNSTKYFISGEDYSFDTNFVILENAVTCIMGLIILYGTWLAYNNNDTGSWILSRIYLVLSIYATVALIYLNFRQSILILNVALLVLIVIFLLVSREFNKIYKLNKEQQSN